jgi:hypothetical protein
MNASESFQALRRANPRAKAGFAASVEATADALHAQLATADVAAAVDAGAPGPSGEHVRPRRLVRASTIAASLAAAAAVAAFLTVGSPGAESAAAAVRKAATVTAASAERSGTAVVRITHGGKPWTGATIRWHGRDLAVSRDVPGRARRVGSELLVVDGVLYGINPINGRWVKLGSPDSIDPGSGTTPDEYLDAVREDVGGVNLRRIIGGMTDLTTRRLGDGSTVYSGTVAAGLIARETGFKEGHPIRVLPFGYVAHDQAANPAAPLHAAVTVSAHGIVREITVTWGTGASVWRYTVTYSRLGATPAPVAPANAPSLRGQLRAGKPQTGLAPASKQRNAIHARAKAVPAPRFSSGGGAGEQASWTKVDIRC